MELFLKLIPLIIFIITSSIGFIVWLLKVEGKVKAHDKEIKEIKDTQNKEIEDIKIKLDKMSDKLTELCVTVGELAGFIKGRDCKDERIHP